MKFKEVFLFIIKLSILVLPIAVIFATIRSDPKVQALISESFPVYHFSKLIMISAKLLLSIFGYHTILLFNHAIYHYGVFSLQINGGIQTFIGFSCLGFGVMWVFMSLIVSWHGKIIPKITYILVGFIIIFILNVFRMSYLTWLGRDGELIKDKTISLFGIRSLDHHDLFNYFIYIIVFIMFLIWIELFSKRYH